MANRVSVARLEAHFFEFLARVCRGEEFPITEKRRTVARFIPALGAGFDAHRIKVLGGSPLLSDEEPRSMPCAQPQSGATCKGNDWLLAGGVDAERNP